MASTARMTTEARAAIAPRPVGAFVHEATPSIQSIMRAFEANGGGDREMLMIILQCKRAEDERLAALDNCRAEELAMLRTAHASRAPTHRIVQGQLMSPPLSTHDDSCPPISSRSSSMSSAASSGGPPSPPPVHVEAFGAGSKKRKRQATDSGDANRPRGPTPPHDVVMAMLRAKTSRTDASAPLSPRRSPSVPAVSPRTAPAPFPAPASDAVQAAHGLASLVHSASTQLPPSRLRPQVSSIRDEL